MRSPEGREGAGRRVEVGGAPMAEMNSQVAKNKSHCIEKSEAKDKN